MERHLRVLLEELSATGEERISMMMGFTGFDVLSAAVGFAYAAHLGQKRKFTGDDYIVHPLRVGLALEPYGVTLQCAGILHDTIEDCGVTREDLFSVFGEQMKGRQIANVVQEVTGPSKQIPDAPRGRRKEVDLRHLAEVSPEAKILKMCDCMDNLRDLQHSQVPFDYLDLRLGERTRLLEVLRDAESELGNRMEQLIQELREWNEERRG